MLPSMMYLQKWSWMGGLPSMTYWQKSHRWKGFQAQHIYRRGPRGWDGIGCPLTVSTLCNPFFQEVIDIFPGQDKQGHCLQFLWNSSGKSPFFSQSIIDAALVFRTCSSWFFKLAELLGNARKICIKSGKGLGSVLQRKLALTFVKTSRSRSNFNHF